MATSSNSDAQPAVDTTIRPASRSRQGSLQAADDLTQHLESLSLKAVVTELPCELQVFLQPACVLHRYERPHVEGQDDISDAEIVERAERMRACQVGIAGVYSRLRSAYHSHLPPLDLNQRQREWKGKSSGIRGSPFDIIRSTARLGLQSPAARFIHNSRNLPPDGQDVSDDLYTDQLLRWLKNVTHAHASQTSEIPTHLSQGDLYLCEKSKDAIEGALGTICQAIDSLYIGDETTQRQAASRFVAIRPPGHHCGHNNPSGFCFVNNVLIGAAHAYLNTDKVDRVVIFDIDLHHGNGTQEIVWRINQDAECAPRSVHNSPRKGTPRQSPVKGPKSPSKAQDASAAAKRPLRIFYSSLHDVLSYPCESGDPMLVANASMRITGSHGQYITNVHLEPYTSVEQFHQSVYPKYAATLFGDAANFLRKTGGTPDNTLVIISAGMDASEHEYSSMSRHNRRVPTTFFSRFAADAKAFANNAESYSASMTPRKATLSSAPLRRTAGKVVAVLEGGYSDRALISGTASLLTGLYHPVNDNESPNTAYGLDWWDLKEIQHLEKATFPSPPAGRRPNWPEWALDSSKLFFTLSGEERSEWERYWSASPAAKREAVPPPPRMTLRRQRSITAETSPLDLKEVKLAVEQLTIVSSEAAPAVTPEVLQSTASTDSERNSSPPQSSESNTQDGYTTASSLDGFGDKKPLDTSTSPSRTDRPDHGPMGNKVRLVWKGQSLT